MEMVSTFLAHLILPVLYCVRKITELSGNCIDASITLLCMSLFHHKMKRSIMFNLSNWKCFSPLIQHNKTISLLGCNKEGDTLPYDISVSLKLLLIDILTVQNWLYCLFDLTVYLSLQSIWPYGLFDVTVFLILSN